MYALTLFYVISDGKYGEPRNLGSWLELVSKYMDR